MKRTIRSLMLGLAAVVGFVAFTPTDSDAAHYWSRVHNRQVEYHFAYHDSHGRPVYVNEYGVNFRHGRRGRHITVATHHPYGHDDSEHHGHGHRHHPGLLGVIFGH